MSRRTYDQYCALATALDVLGERWTLLIVRNLMYGPKRFKDLHNGLPGIGTGLLAERLKQLQDADVVVRTTLPPPASVAAYALTPDGEALREVLVGLARWGLPRVGPRADRPLPGSDLLALALEARFEPALAAGAEGVYQLRIDATPYRAEIRDGALDLRIGAAERPRATATTDTDTLVALNDGTQSLQQAVTSGRVGVEGDVAAVMAFAAAFGLA